MMADRHIACRLDRFLVSESIMESGSEIHSLVLPVVGSDHCPIEFNRIIVPLDLQEMSAIRFLIIM